MTNWNLLPKNPTDWTLGTAAYTFLLRGASGGYLTQNVNNDRIIIGANANPIPKHTTNWNFENKS